MMTNHHAWRRRRADSGSGTNLPRVSAISAVRAGCTLIAALLVGSCTEPTTPASTLDITPKDATVLVGGSVQFSALNAQGLVTWTSGDPTVATVVSTGFATSAKRGSVQITAADSRGSVSTTMVVRARAELALSATALTFAQQLGSPDAPAQTVQLTDAGDDKVGALTVSGINYAAGQAGGWLTATLSGSAAPAQLSVRTSAGALQPGTYTATVSLNAAGAAGLDKTVAVTFAVSAAPTIQLSTSTLAFTGLRGVGNIPSQSVTITNGGGGTLSQLTATIAYGAGQPTGWLAATPTATTAPTLLTMQPTLQALSDGTYNATITVAAAGATPRTIAVTLTVLSNTIVLSSNAVTFAGTAGAASPPAQNVNVSNSGGSSLTGLAVAVSYTAGQPTGWLTTATFNATTAPAVLSLRPTVGALTSGTYTATVSVSSPVAVNSPQNITVTLVVTNVPIIALSTSTVDFSGSAGGAAPVAQTVTISNAGAATLSGLAVAVSYGAGQPTGWLTTATFSATNAPATLTLRPTIGPLAAGTYTATVAVSSPVASNSAQNITVTLVVVSSPIIVLSQSAVTFTASVGGSSPAERITQVSNAGTGTLTGLVVATTYQAGQATGWLTATLGSATGPTTLSLQVVTGALAAGAYTATVAITSPVASNSPQLVTVTFTVSTNAIIALSSTTVNFAGLSGGPSPASQTVTVSNSGTGVLNQLSATIAYAGGQPTGWLTQASLSTIQAPATLTLGTTVGALPAGTYTATVSVASPIAANSPQAVTVTLVVSTAPSIGLSATTVAFNTTFGGAQPAAQSINITNAGSGALTGLVVSITYGAGQPSGWLTTASLSATTAPATLQLRPMVMANGGTFTATVNIAAPGAVNTPRQITVTYTVMVSFATHVYPQMVTSCIGCHFATGSAMSPMTNLSSALIAYNNLVNVATSRRPPTHAFPLAATHPIRVVPGSASTSYLLDQVLKLVGADPMPTSAAMMPASWIDRFREWINLGAPFN